MLREALFIEPPKAKTCRILADTAASLADFKKDPIGTLHECSGETVVILDHNAPVFYAVPTERYEAMLQMIDDTRLAEAIRRRQDEPTVRADIDDSIAKAGKAD